MPSSNEILRQATKLVSRYQQPMEYYASECSKAIDPEDVSFSPEYIIKLNKSHIVKLLELVDRANEEAQRLIEHIENQQTSFFVKHIYRSSNWSISHKLLRDFVINKLNKYRIVAGQHTNRIEQYSLAPKPKYYESIHEAPGDYHDEIQVAVDELRRMMRVPQDKQEISDINYSLLLLIHASCCIIKSHHRVKLYVTEWNTFKSSLESWFYDIADAEPPKNTMTKTQDGGTIITDYAPRCRSDIDKVEQHVETHIDAPDVLSIIANELPAIQHHCTNVQLNKCLEWLCQHARERIMPKIIYAFREDF